MSIEISLSATPTTATLLLSHTEKKIINLFFFFFFSIFFLKRTHPKIWIINYLRFLRNFFFSFFSFLFASLSCLKPLTEVKPGLYSSLPRRNAIKGGGREPKKKKEKESPHPNSRSPNSSPCHEEEEEEECCVTLGLLVNAEDGSLRLPVVREKHPPRSGQMCLPLPWG